MKIWMDGEPGQMSFLISSWRLRPIADKTVVNQYLDTNAPWKQVKEDKAEAGKTIYTSLKAIDSLKVMFAPILPFTSEKLHSFFGYETPLFGSLPELDSMAVVNVVTALEEHFGFEIEDDEITAETFETLGSLSAFVAGKLDA